MMHKEWAKRTMHENPCQWCFKIAWLSGETCEATVVPLAHGPVFSFNLFRGITTLAQDFFLTAVSYLPWVWDYETTLCSPKLGNILYFHQNFSKHTICPGMEARVPFPRLCALLCTELHCAALPATTADRQLKEKIWGRITNCITARGLIFFSCRSSPTYGPQATTLLLSDNARSWTCQIDSDETPKIKPYFSTMRVTVSAVD